MNKKVTNLELSKKLKELGCKQESEFVYTKTEQSKHFTLRRSGSMSFKFMEKHNVEVYSAFLSCELGELLPQTFHLTRQRRYDDLARIKEGSLFHGDVYLYSTKNSDCWEVGYNSHVIRGFEFFEDTEANARAKCLCYLLENDIIDVNEINK